MRTKCFAVATLLLSSLALAQEPEPRVIVVPYPGEAAAGVDAGTAGAAVAPAPPPPVAQPQPEVAPPPTPPQTVTPDPNRPPEPPKTIEASGDNGEMPPPPPPENLVPTEVPSSPPSAMLDGHPREGAFLSGPGSLAFVLHHTLLGLTMGLSTQIFPRVLSNPKVDATDQGARLAYLAAGLVGAGLGFATSAAWQFYNWMSESSAYYGLANSIFGGMFGAGLVNLIVPDATATSWAAWVGALAGAWLTTIIGGGDLAVNKGLLMVSGAYWAFMFAAVIVATIATTSPGGEPRKGVDALLMAPALGAGAMALALLKFNPSSAQILRADLFGTLAGGAVLLISALVLGAKFDSPVPYVLGGVAAAGGITIVSLLWAEAAESPPPPVVTPDGKTQNAKPKYQGVW